MEYDGISMSFHSGSQVSTGCSITRGNRILTHQKKEMSLRVSNNGNQDICSYDMFAYRN